MAKQAHGGNLVWAAALAGCPPSAILDFSASISPLGPPDSVIAAIQSQLSNIKHYPDPNTSELKLALSHYHQLPSEWILPGNGSAELLTLVGRELAQATTILMTPAFGDYYRSLAAYDAKVLEFPLISADYCVSQVELNNLIPRTHDSANTNWALIINNPHNPTGRLFLRQEIVPLLARFALVVVDEAFMDFLPPHDEQSLVAIVQQYPSLVILRSLTKFYSVPGLRLGYAIAHPDRLRRWQSWRDPWSVNTLASAAGVAALQDKKFQSQTWEWLSTARNSLFEGLAQIPGLHPYKGEANFLLVKSEYSCEKLQQRLLKHHKILIRDCQSFPQLGDSFFRIAVRTVDENERLLMALRGEWGVGSRE